MEEEKTKKEIIEMIEKITDQLKEKETILIICKKFMNETSERVRYGKITYSAGLVYLACRKIRLPITAENIGRLSEVDAREIKRKYKELKRKLGMRVCKKATMMGSKCVTYMKPSDYIKTFCDKLGASEKSRKEAEKIARNYDQNTRGRHPQAIAGSSIYLALLMNLDKRTQREVADVSMVNEVTLRSGYKKILEENNLLNQTIEEKYQEGLEFKNG